MKSRTYSILIFKILPTALLSRIFGWCARIPLPGFIMNPLMRWYIDKFGVRADEMYPNVRFRNFNEFFTRSLRPGVHVIDHDEKSIVSPVDAVIDQFGPINGLTLMQAKGIEYSIKDLIPADDYRHFENGLFVTLYLSPGDYHRIHAPAGGHITGYCSVPGRLFTVQNYMVTGIRNLFARNERLITYIKTNKGLAAVCKIGAMNVGRISVSYDKIQTNAIFRKKTEKIYPLQDAYRIAKGEELGIFHLGSTVILLLEKGMAELDPLVLGHRVRVGQRIARFR